MIETALEAQEADIVFTSREEEVLRLLADLRTNEEMCEKLTIKRGTLVNHFKNIKRKTRIRTARKEVLIRYAIQHGYGEQEVLA